MIDLNSLFLFVKVIERGSFTAASDHTGIPVATVSRRVKELEESLNLRLIERSTRRIRLTESGQILYDFAIRGVEEIEAGQMALQDKETEVKGKLRISAPPSFEPWYALLNDFRQAYPNIDVDLFVSSRKVDLIEDGVDVALRVGDVVQQTVVARKLLRYSHLLVASPCYIEKYGEPTNPADLMHMKTGVWRRHHEKRSWRCGDSEVDINPVIQVNDYLHLRYLAVKGEIITELPPFFCKEQLQSGELIPILQDHPFPEQEVSLVYPTRKQISRLSRVYIDFCVENVGKYL